MRKHNYRTLYDSRLRALFGSKGGCVRFFSRHPWWGLAAAYCRLAYRQRIDPLTAARDWFDHKAVPQLGDDSLTDDAHALQAARRAGLQKNLF
jgi:hypothetical protein